MGNDTEAKYRSRFTAEEVVPPSLQESIVALIAFDKRGAEVFAWLQPHHFDEPANEIVAACQDYWKKYNKPPGRGHLDDLFTQELVERPRGRIANFLHKIVLLENGMNAQFVLDQVIKLRREQDLKAALLAAGERYSQGGPGLVEEVESILRKTLDQAPLPAAGKVAETTNMKDKKDKKPQWIWRDRIPRGRHITMTGLPFVGKSLLLAAFVAQYSRGARNPDGSPAPRGRILLLSGEDVLADVFKPRLKAAGADMSRIEVLGMIRTDKGKRSFLLAEDIQLLKEMILARPDTLMVGIDPITAYVGGKIDSHKATDVRSVLQPLTDLAEETGVTVFSVTHPAKSSQAAINSFVGSQAFIAVPRMGYLVAKELDEEKRETGRILFSCVGSNLGVTPSTLAYRIENTWVTPDDEPDRSEVERRLAEYLAGEPDADPANWPADWKKDKFKIPGLGRYRLLRMQAEKDILGDIPTAKIVWDAAEDLDVTADEILAAGTRSRGDALDGAVMFLRVFLKAGPRPSDEVNAEAEVQGISEKTLKRAKKKICRSYRAGGLAGDGSWVCELKKQEDGAGKK
jgi:hypothetical protein